MAFLEPAEWYATLPTVYVSASMLMTDHQDRILLVKPNYRPGWSIPGGVLDEGELPHDCASREIAEELGLSVPAGDLLVLHWAPRFDDRPKPMINFVFDGGIVDGLDEVRLQAEELDDAGFFDW